MSSSVSVDSVLATGVPSAASTLLRSTTSRRTGRADQTSFAHAACSSAEKKCVSMTLATSTVARSALTSGVVTVRPPSSRKCVKPVATSRT
jgi:hypothetical protein